MASWHTNNPPQRPGIDAGTGAGASAGRAGPCATTPPSSATSPFGDGDAERLRPLLRRVPVDGLARVGDWLVDCETGEEMIRRVEALAANGSPTGCRGR